MLTDKAKEILEQVAREIEAEPLRINMNDWLLLKEEVKPECGIVGCIAGWVVALSVDKSLPKLEDIGVGRVQDMAKSILSLTEEQENRLFFKSNWPYSFRYEIEGYPAQSPEYAQVVARRIRYFISTEGSDIG